MKLKKIAAVAAAAVMSLAMLTACGGGGGGSAAANGWTRKLITVEYNGQTVSESEAEVSYGTSNGTWTYIEIKDPDDTEEGLLGPNDESYEVNTTSEPWRAFKSTDSSAKPIKTTTVEEFEDYKGKAYKVAKDTDEYADGEKVISTYYYDISTGKLEYVKTEQQNNGRDYISVDKVLIDTAKVDPDNAEKLNIKNYKIVTDYDDLYDDFDVDD